MANSMPVDPSQVHVEGNVYSPMPTVSKYVAPYSVSTQPKSDSLGRINSAFSGVYDEGSNSFYNTVPFNSLHNGNSGRYTVNRVNVASSGTGDEEVNAEKSSKCCSCTRSCLIIGLVVGGTALILIIVGLVVGLVLGLPKHENLVVAKTLRLTGTLRINMTWIYDLSDHSSAAYLLLNSKVYSAVSWVMENSSFNEVYLLYEPISFRRGSVLAQFRLDVNVTTATSADVLNVLQDGFKTLIDLGAFPDWYLVPDSDIWLEDCGENDFWCPDGTCLVRDFICDKIVDCFDFSDEQNCSCPKTEFQCDMGMCIDGWRQCDKNYDCPDKSDEINCVCPMGQFLCTNGTKGTNGTCIMSEWLCDREKDCPDGQDESNCGHCSSNQFQCRDYGCVNISSRCDGIYNCSDFSDEQRCVRQDVDLMVEGLSKSAWLPFCSASVSNVTANEVCLALGLSGMISKSTKTYASEMYLKFNTNRSDSETSAYNIMAAFQPGVDCANSSALVLQCATRVCGVSTVDNVPESLIVHGTDAAPGKWPWQVAIYKNLAFLCGGTLLDQYHVVTAAHCLPDVSSSYTVLLGSNSRTRPGTTGIFRTVKFFEIHPKYEIYHSGYDIAMLTLRDPVNYTDYVRPICLTDPEDELPLSSLCYSTGWGNTDFNRSNYLPELLQQGKMRLWSDDDCRSSYPFATPLMLCAGYASGYIANCPGDSGGPLVCKDSRGFWKLVGVFSFLALGCNVPLKPSVFTDVQEFYSWIDDKMTCKFFCNNGKCIWDLNSLCNAVDDCGDMTDELKTCKPSITCDFEENYICGYTNAVQTSQLGSWVRRSGPAGLNQGPIVDATYGNKSGHYMYSSARRAILLAPIYHQVETHCLQFRLNVRAVKCGGFHVFIQPTTFLDIPPKNISLDNITNLWQWPPDYCNLDLWQMFGVDIDPGTFVLGFEAYADFGQTSTSMAMDDVRLLNGSCASQVCATDKFTCVMDKTCIPKSDQCNFYTNCIDISDEVGCAEKSYSCDFERYGSCGLEQTVVDEMDWIVSPATEAASYAGCPNVDHTSGTPQGNILFIDTLHSSPGYQAIITLPIETSSTPGCLRMYYSMVSQGRIKVDFVSSTNQWLPVWSVTQGNISSWQLLQLVLPVGVSLISIGGITGVESATASTSCIAIDDITISDGNCTRPVCTAQEFGCDDGLCIYHEHICDGINDCQDNSDEKPGLCVCRPESFYCGSGECLQGHVRCDGIRNCNDSSDELNCEICDSATEYKCASDGKCKLRSTWCDGTIDCIDGSDELKNCACLPEQFRCANGHCILAVEYCNGKVDCVDASDEPIGCSCSKAGLFSCSDGTCVGRCNLVRDCSDGSDEINCTQFQCLTGSKISSQQRCDGVVDCQNADDEHNCVCGAADFRCTGGPCISRSKVCDGLFDCRDLSDERNCTCQGNQMKCATGICLPSNYRCNGYNDCGDFSDEWNCTCAPNQFRCSNGICLSTGFRCNSNDDCGDGSDELNCTCKSKEIRCSDGKCLQPEWICDGYPDCKDAKDEFNCSSCNNDTQFTCRLDYTCIPLSWRCDGEADCHDNSDEHGCVVQRTYNGTSNVLYGYRNGSFYPLCTEFWSEMWSLGVCASFGSDDTLATSFITLSSAETFLEIPDDSSSLSYNLSRLQLSSTCQNKQAVRLSCLPSSCGRPTYTSIVPYIVRGDLATEGQWPWAAALLYNGIYRCTAVLINEEWLMTAAHCIKNPSNGYSLESVPQYFTAVLGTTKRVGFSSHLQIVTFKRIFVHPKYVVVNNVQYNDIALLQMTSVVSVGDFVNPVCLPKAAYAGPLCYAAGWGVTSDSDLDEAPVDLRQAKMDVWSYDVCSRPEFWGSRVTNDTQLCVGYATGYIAMCHGDSGGPLMCRDLNNRWTLQGVVSTGVNMCVQIEPAKPTIFTNVSYFMPWITSILRQNRR